MFATCGKLIELHNKSSGLKRFQEEGILGRKKQKSFGGEHACMLYNHSQVISIVFMATKTC